MRLIKHIKRWNKWRKSNGNSRLHKLMVLFGIVKSPTFYLVWTDEEAKSFREGFMEGLNSVKDEN
jgi:hypothetical protein